MKQFVELVTRFVKKIKTKVWLKIFFITFVVLFMTFSICFLGLNVYLNRIYQKEFRQQFDELTVTFSEQFETASSEQLEEFAKEFGKQNSANITIMDPTNQDIIFRYSYWGEIDADELVQSSVIGFSNNETGVGYAFYAETSLAAVNRVIAGLSETLPVLFLVSLLISLIVSSIYGYSLAKPIVKISEMSKKMKNLDLSASCEIRRKDEIGELAYNLNEMSERLREALNDLQQANDKLQEDMERERELEKRRKDLFTAISHELKTPLTILKGEIGGMIDKIGVYQNRDEYLDHAYKTTESMEQLVKDILLVTQIEAEDIKLNFQMKDIGVLVSNICQDYERIAEEKGVALTYYFENNIIENIDETQLQHAMRNLVSNAIFHSPKGAMVDIQLVKAKDEYKLTIENSGVHIAEEDIQNIFNPFYRAEKSRNRHTGGSGLGLFIVKRILELHHFEYVMENSAEGVLFTISF